MSAFVQPPAAHEGLIVTHKPAPAAPKHSVAPDPRLGGYWVYGIFPDRCTTHYFIPHDVAIDAENEGWQAALEAVLEHRAEVKAQKQGNARAEAD